MANVTIHQLETSNQPSLSDEIALYEVSSDNTKNTTLNALKEPLGISTIEGDISDLEGNISTLGESIFTLEEKETALESDIQQVRGEIPSNLKNGNSIGSLRSIGSNPNYTMGSDAFAEGSNTQAIGSGSHAEGSGSKASGDYSHAEGRNTQAKGYYSHAEGNNAQASGESSHAEGQGTNATETSSHAEGSNTYARGLASHAEGRFTKADGNYSHASGNGTIAIGDQETTIGKYNLSSGVVLNFTGDGTTSTFNLSVDHADKVTINGIIRDSSTWSSQNNQLTFTTPPNNGAKIIAYCAEEGKTFGEKAFIIGNGVDDDNRSNAFSVDWDGNINATNNIKISQLNAGVYGVDQTNTEYPLIYDNGVNLWIGSETTNARHHVGWTHLSTGWNPNTGTGNPTIRIAVPNEGNTSASVYDAIHSGIWPYISRKRASKITRNTNIMYGLISAKSSENLYPLTMFCPLSLITESFTYDTGSATNPISLTNFLKIVKNLTINIAVPGSVYFKHRTDSSGNTATNISGANINIINDSQVVKTNAISRWSLQAHSYSGFRITLHFKNPLTTSASGTTEVQKKTSFVGYVTYQLDLSQAPTT